MATLVEGDDVFLNTSYLVSPNGALLENVDANLISEGVVEDCIVAFAHSKEGIIGGVEKILCQDLELVAKDSSRDLESFAGHLNPNATIFLPLVVGSVGVKALVDVHIDLVSPNVVSSYVEVGKGLFGW
ncbi:hypothetical protein MA16_Dca019940 [Dendrobium catenatum]|uniref:Uncharacterized protein n=1 Tax=Dendrobium catenatum TaxID=906689 RepID=A0A2I0VN94_9ASPA|nr:hypothetical protein MA16_Dca019940 [Dendrobium catenatum]